jgi:hypothetical protein
MSKTQAKSIDWRKRKAELEAELRELETMESSLQERELIHELIKNLSDMEYSDHPDKLRTDLSSARKYIRTAYHSLFEDGNGKSGNRAPRGSKGEENRLKDLHLLAKFKLHLPLKGMPNAQNKLKIDEWVKQHSGLLPEQISDRLDKARAKSAK